MSASKGYRDSRLRRAEELWLGSRHVTCAFLGGLKVVRIDLGTYTAWRFGTTTGLDPQAMIMDSQPGPRRPATCRNVPHRFAEIRRCAPR